MRWMTQARSMVLATPQDVIELDKRGFIVRWMTRLHSMMFLKTKLRDCAFACHYRPPASALGNHTLELWV